MNHLGLQQISEGLKVNFENKDMPSQVLFINFFFDLVRFCTSNDYATLNYKLQYNPPQEMKADYLLRKGGILHAGIHNMYINHIPSLVLDNQLNQMSIVSIESETLNLYKKKFSAFFQKLWEEGDIYKMDGVYFCLSSKEVFWVQDFCIRHIA